MTSQKEPPMPERIPSYVESRTMSSTPTSFESTDTTDVTKVNSRVTDKTDDDLVSAAEALASLTHRSPSPGASPSVSEGASPLEQHPLVARVNQVSKHPLVTNAVRYYESSKRNYAPFNYAAGIVEKAAIPVVNKIEVNLNSRHRKREAVRTKRVHEEEEERQPNEEEKSRVETTKRLHFCLHVLRLANDHINNKVNQLQQRMLDREKEKERKRGDEQQDKTEIVTTVRKIIHLISNFKPSSLGDSEQVDLRGEIRDIILQLPSTIQQSAIHNGEQANDKILIFARESLEMITKLSTVFSEQLEKAENWVGDKRVKVEPFENGAHSPAYTTQTQPTHTESSQREDAI